VSLSGANFHALAWLPPEIQDLNVGIIALAVNVLVLIVVSLAMRLAAAPARAPAE
jgi:SSS family solute:Na+ symporter